MTHLSVSQRYTVYSEIVSSGTPYIVITVQIVQFRSIWPHRDLELWHSGPNI